MLPSHWIQVGRTDTAVMSDRATAASMSSSPNHFDSA
jgi:hypothetical protein